MRTPFREVKNKIDASRKIRLHLFPRLVIQRRTPPDLAHGPCEWGEEEEVRDSGHPASVLCPCGCKSGREGRAKITVTAQQGGRTPGIKFVACHTVQIRVRSSQIERLGRGIVSPEHAVPGVFFPPLEGRGHVTPRLLRRLPDLRQIRLFLRPGRLNGKHKQQGEQRNPPRCPEADPGRDRGMPACCAAVLSM